MTTPPRLRLKLRTSLARVAVLALTLAYAGSYCELRRRGMRDEFYQYGTGFTYVPFKECMSNDRTASGRAIARHYRLLTWYAPLNWIDRRIFGGPPPASCFLRISG
jgi:hypothetical protein